MIAYLIKSAACLLLLLLVYHAFLEREKMHKFNRYFLLFCLVFSLSIPLLTIEIGTPTQLTDQITDIKNRLSAEPPATTEYVPVPDTESQRNQIISDSSNNYTTVLIALYSVITSILLVRLLRNLYLLVKKIRVNPRVSLDTCTLVLINDCDMPHSFFSYIFVSTQLYESGQIRAEILNHERTHARQRHSLDILFIEVLKVLYWFNPVLWFYKKAMQVNHEFLADQSVVAGTTDVQSYQKMLLKMQSGSKNLQLASSIQFSITKKRIIMMTKKSSRLRTLCKQLALIPLAAGLAFIFCTKTAAAQDVSTMSLPELMDVVASKMETVDSLSVQEKEELSTIITEIQKKLKFQVPPPPAPAPISESKEKRLQRVAESLQEHARFYADIKPVPENRAKLEASYEKLMILYDEVVKMEREVKENPPPPPPKPLKPAKRIERHAKKSTSTPTQQNEKLSERNILRVLINSEGLILLDEEPIPLDEVTASVKKFITNNGTDPGLSDSPQEARIFLKTARKTPYKVYTKMLENIHGAYLEVRNIVSQAEYGVNFEKLVENNSAKTKIQAMYPVRISIADPEQKEDKNKTPPPPKPSRKEKTHPIPEAT